jgi:cytochrome bd-type quinol oxidase subunit 2
MSRPAARPLPDRLDRAADAGVYALVAGIVLGLFAFLTNPVPDPSFPWATLPASLRLPVTQPRIEHWPVTYTLAVWTWVFALPFALLAAYRRYAPRTRLGPSAWLVGLPAALMVALTTYCRFFWPKLYPPSWNAPSYTLVCWGYCSSYVPAWSDLAYAVAAGGVAAFLLARSSADRGRLAAAAFGALALPLGLPALVYARRA